MQRKCKISGQNTNARTVADKKAPTNQRHETQKLHFSLQKINKFELCTMCTAYTRTHGFWLPDSQNGKLSSSWLNLKPDCFDVIDFEWKFYWISPIWNCASETLVRVRTHTLSRSHETATNLYVFLLCKTAAGFSDEKKRNTNNNNQHQHPNECQRMWKKDYEQRVSSWKHMVNDVRWTFLKCFSLFCFYVRADFEFNSSTPYYIAVEFVDAVFVVVVAFAGIIIAFIPSIPYRLFTGWTLFNHFFECMHVCLLKLAFIYCLSHFSCVRWMMYCST